MVFVEELNNRMTFTCLNCGKDNATLAITFIPSLDGPLVKLCDECMFKTGKAIIDYLYFEREQPKSEE